MQTLFPPASKQARPTSRLPKVPGSQTTDAPSPCSEKPPHEYINFPSLSKASSPRQGQRYVNVSEVLDDPVVQQARENYIAASATNLAADEPNYVNLKR